MAGGRIRVSAHERQDVHFLRRVLLAFALALALLTCFAAAQADFVFIAPGEELPLKLPETIEVLEGRELSLSDVTIVEGSRLTLSKGAEKVVKLENGVLKPVKAGVAVLTARRGKETAKADVQVFSDESAAEEALEHVNAARKKAGVKALKLSDGLNKVAAARAKELPDKFSHTRPDGRSFTTAYAENGVKYGYKGENIAAGQFGPEQVTRDWLGLKEHKANILYSKFTRMGIAYHITESGTVCWVQVFGG